MLIWPLAFNLNGLLLKVFIVLSEIFVVDFELNEGLKKLTGLLPEKRLQLSLFLGFHYFCVVKKFTLEVNNLEVNNPFCFEIIKNPRQRRKQL